MNGEISSHCVVLNLQGILYLWNKHEFSRANLMRFLQLKRTSKWEPDVFKWSPMFRCCHVGIIRSQQNKITVIDDIARIASRIITWASCHSMGYRPFSQVAWKTRTYSSKFGNTATLLAYICMYPTVFRKVPSLRPISHWSRRWRYRRFETPNISLVSNSRKHFSCWCFKRPS